MARLHTFGCFTLKRFLSSAITFFCLEKVFDCPWRDLNTISKSLTIVIHSFVGSVSLPRDRVFIHVIGPVFVLETFPVIFPKEGSSFLTLYATYPATYDRASSSAQQLSG